MESVDILDLLKQSIKIRQQQISYAIWECRHNQMSHPDIVLAYLIFLYLSGRHYRLRGRKTIADVAWCLIPILT
jgi:hypothetical protein